MLPVLFTLGPVTVHSFSLFLGIGFLLSVFIAWRRLTDLGLDEEKVLDGIILSAIGGLIFSKLVFALENFPLSGYSFWGGIGGAVVVFCLIIKVHKWDFWPLADELAFAVLPFAVLTQVGALLQGSTPGKPTLAPWGIYFPGTLVRSQPISLFMAVGFFAIWIFLLRIEREWRTWAWHKSKDPGLVFLLFLGLGAGLTLMVDFLTLTRIYWLLTKTILGLIFLLGAGVSLFYRSGNLIWRRKKDQ